LRQTGRASVARTGTGGVGAALPCGAMCYRPGEDSAREGCARHFSHVVAASVSCGARRSGPPRVAVHQGLGCHASLGDHASRVAWIGFSGRVRTGWRRGGGWNRDDDPAYRL
jgi:hypothetical protein